MEGNRAGNGERPGGLVVPLPDLEDPGQNESVEAGRPTREGKAKGRNGNRYPRKGTERL